MGFQTVFKRYELKYLITRDQKEYLLGVMEPYMTADQYGRCTIRNLYFDTDSYRLIRHSVEKPLYKEKLRLRSYTRASKDSTVFVELKKKYNSVVYKRRTPMREEDAMGWLCKGRIPPKNTQITREIDYFLSYYGDLLPKVFLSYEREAFYSRDASGFRVTFDDNILCRRDELSLTSQIGGESILEKDHILMELKTSGGIPLWMVSALSKEKIYKTAFSKYGTAYNRLILPEIREEKKDGFII